MIKPFFLFFKLILIKIFALVPLTIFFLRLYSFVYLERADYILEFRSTFFIF